MIMVLLIFLLAVDGFWIYKSIASISSMFRTDLSGASLVSALPESSESQESSNLEQPENPVKEPAKETAEDPTNELASEEEIVLVAKEDVEITVDDGGQDRIGGIDDALEKFDWSNSHVPDLQGKALAKDASLENTAKENTAESALPQENENSGQELITDVLDEAKEQEYQNPSSNGPAYPKILISEFQIGGADDSKEEFVELYNAGGDEIDLTGWYLQRKTATANSYSTFISSALFSGKKISADGYFLIARQGYFVSLADIFTENPITDDNVLVLKNPNGDVSDKVGFGKAQDYEFSPAQAPLLGASLGRKMIAGKPHDTDVNSDDFEKTSPTPKAKNMTYVEVLEAEEAVSLPEDAASSKVLLGPDMVSKAENINIAPKKILINEIQIDSKVGSGGTADDWVELYNPNDVEVDLSDWSIQKHSSDEACSISKSYFKKNFEKGAKIPAKGFFLVVNSGANSDLTNMADMTTNWSLSNNNTIYLVSSREKIAGGDDEAIVDKVGFGSGACFPETSLALNPNAGESIERKSLGQDSDDNGQDFVISAQATPKY